MGEAKRKKARKEQSDWPSSDTFQGAIDLHMLPPVPAINGARIRELTGDDQIPDTAQISLRVLRAVVGDRTFHVGFCLGNETGFSAIGIAVIERLMMEAPDASLHIVRIVHEDIAWDIVLRHLRSFTGRVLLFAFPDSDVYDAGTAETFYSSEIRLFSDGGKQLERLTAAQRRKIRQQKSAILNRLPSTHILSGGRCGAGRLALDIPTGDACREGDPDRRLERPPRLCPRIPSGHLAMGWR
jgi:hypothetical protein